MVMLRTDKLTGVSLGQALPSAPELRPTGGNALRTRTTSSAPPSRSWLGERAGRQPTQGIRTRHQVYRRPQVRHRVGMLVSHALGAHGDGDMDVPRGLAAAGRHVLAAEPYMASAIARPVAFPDRHPPGPTDSASSLDLDPADPCLLGPRHPDRQHPVVKPRRHLVGVHSGGQRRAVVERARAPRAVTQDAGPLPLLRLAADREL